MFMSSIMRFFLRYSVGVTLKCCSRLTASEPVKIGLVRGDEG